VLLNLGREDKLDPDGLRRLVASINRYLVRAAGADDVREAVGDAPTVTDARPLGAVWLLHGLWRQLGVEVALRQVLRPPVHHRRGAGAVRAGREPRRRPAFEAVPGGVGRLRRGDPGAGQHR
jgi:hypothetical protein